MIAMMHCSHVWLPRKPLALTAWNRLHEPIVNSLLGCRKVHRHVTCSWDLCHVLQSTLFKQIGAAVTVGLRWWSSWWIEREPYLSWVKLMWQWIELHWIVLWQNRGHAVTLAGGELALAPGRRASHNGIRWSILAPPPQKKKSFSCETAPYARRWCSGFRFRIFGLVFPLVSFGPPFDVDPSWPAVAARCAQCTMCPGVSASVRGGTGVLRRAAWRDRRLLLRGVPRSQAREHRSASWRPGHGRGEFTCLQLSRTIVWHSQPRSVTSCEVFHVIIALNAANSLLLFFFC